MTNKKTKSRVNNRVKKLLLPMVSIVFILCLMFFPKISVNAASKGLRLWADVVFPSLFPFFVVSELLEKSGFVQKIGKVLEPIMRPLFNVPGCGAFVLAMGVTSGYPVGAKITTELKKQNLLTKKEAERLLAFTNNSGPLFLIGAVATGMFRLPVLGFILLGSHIAACITVGLIFGICSKKNSKATKSTVKKNSNAKSFVVENSIRKSDLFQNKQKSTKFTIVFGNAISNSVLLLLKICGFIVLFSVIINLLLETGSINVISTPIAFLLKPFGIEQYIINVVISGIFEITTAINLIAGANNISITAKAVLASLIAGWAGLSVHAQVTSITSEENISLKPYLLGKLLQGMISCIYTYLFMQIIGEKITLITPTFLNILNTHSNVIKPIYFTPLLYFVVSSAVIASMGVILILFKKMA